MGIRQFGVPPPSLHSRSSSALEMFDKIGLSPGFGENGIFFYLPPHQAIWAASVSPNIPLIITWPFRVTQISDIEQ